MIPPGVVAAEALQFVLALEHYASLVGGNPRSFVVNRLRTSDFSFLEAFLEKEADDDAEKAVQKERPSPLLCEAIGRCARLLERDALASTFLHAAQVRTALPELIQQLHYQAYMGAPWNARPERGNLLRICSLGEQLLASPSAVLNRETAVSSNCMALLYSAIAQQHLLDGPRALRACAAARAMAVATFGVWSTQACLCELLSARIARASGAHDKALDAFHHALRMLRRLEGARGDGLLKHGDVLLRWQHASAAVVREMLELLVQQGRHVDACAKLRAWGQGERLHEDAALQPMAPLQRERAVAPVDLARVLSSPLWAFVGEPWTVKARPPLSSAGRPPLELQVSSARAEATLRRLRLGLAASFEAHSRIAAEHLRRREYAAAARAVDDAAQLLGADVTAADPLEPCLHRSVTAVRAWCAVLAHPAIGMDVLIEWSKAAINATCSSSAGRRVGAAGRFVTNKAVFFAAERPMRRFCLATALLARFASACCLLLSRQAGYAASELDSIAALLDVARRYLPPAAGAAAAAAAPRAIAAASAEVGQEGDVGWTTFYMPPDERQLPQHVAAHQQPLLDLLLAAGDHSVEPESVSHIDLLTCALLCQPHGTARTGAQVFFGAASSRGLRWPSAQEGVEDGTGAAGASFPASVLGKLNMTLMLPPYGRMTRADGVHAMVLIRELYSQVREAAAGAGGSGDGSSGVGGYAVWFAINRKLARTRRWTRRRASSGAEQGRPEGEVVEEVEEEASIDEPEEQPVTDAASALRVLARSRLWLVMCRMKAVEASGV
jgi:hypothetical protein